MSPTSRDAAAPERALREQFVSLEQQREADALGMWLFLGTEVLLFGGLFTAYLIYRLTYSHAFVQASQHMDVVLGTVNTAVLMTSSLTMALAVLAARRGRRRRVMGMLGLTALLGLVFLGIKGYEWYKEYHEGLVPLPGLPFTFLDANPEHAEIFFNLYFTMTGLHGVHLLVGIIIVLVMLTLTARGHHPTLLEYKVEIAGLYWHLVDVMWVFIFPIFYLVERHGA